MNIKKIFFYTLCFFVTYIHATEKQFHLSNGWFPNDAEKLEKKLDELQIVAQTNYAATVQKGSVPAVIVPHAGIKYSGAVASAVYQQAHNSVKTIIILTPDHAGKVSGVALPLFDAYAIPTGTLSVNTNVVKKLSEQPFFNFNDSAFYREHSLEIQLPFIKKFFKHVNIVPLIVGKINCAQAKLIATELTPYINKKTLVVVSSDFVHYGKRFNYTPFDDHQQLRIRHLNSHAIELIEHGTCAPFANFVQKTGATICGANPIKILLSLLELNAFGNVEPRFIAYDTSSKSDTDNVVSYVGMLFTTQKLASLPHEQQLTQYEKTSLLTEAHDVLNHLHDEHFMPTLYYPIKSFGLKQAKGAFTTFDTADDKLRGCIGRIITSGPLYKTVADVTIDTALKDTRFSPVTKEEVPSLKLKLSILDQPKKVKGYKNIIIGKHGIILKSNGKSAVFLPEVPIDFKWNLQQTLTRLTKKAQLPADIWKTDDAQFEVFTTFDIQKKK